MNVGSLFSGIGGLDLGLARAGFRHAFFCESDAWRRTVLAHHFPGVPIYRDVREVGPYEGTRKQSDGRPCPDSRPDQWSDCDLLCGGFPCQDVSVAGRRAGLAGVRSGLFYEFARIAESLRPRWILVENVPGLLSSNGGRDFGAVIGTLADIGYGVAWRILDSRYFGVPQRRRRVFVLGAIADGDPRAAAERAGEILAVGSRCERHPATRGEAGKDVAGTLGGGAGERGWAQDTERMTFVADTVRSLPRPGSNSDGNLVAAPLSHGSNPNSNMAGRRREDDENLVLTEGQRLGGPVPVDRQAVPTDTSGLLPLRECAGSSSKGPKPAHSDDLTGPLGGGNDGTGRCSEDDPNLVAYAINENQRAEVRLDEATDSMKGAGGKPGQGYQAALIGQSVRRLTPTECERLQALPDGWTAHGPDSRRYAALGDAVTASVSEWIGRRLLAYA